MRTELILPPEWLDLGDINGAKVGDEIATLDIKKGNVTVKGWGIVRLVEDRRILTKNGGWLKKNLGAAPYFMGYGTFYYSANPKHIAEAKRKSEREKKRTLQKQENDKKKVAKFHAELARLMEKHGASLSISFGEGADTHGIYDEKILATVGNQSLEVE